MRNFRKLIVTTCVLFFAVASQAQNQEKFGHLDFATLYSMMPGIDSVKVQYEQYAKSVQEQYNAMQTEYQNKVVDYQSNQATLSAIIKQTKEREIQDLQSRIEAFQISAQQDLQDKEAALSEPLIEKARNAVKEVAKENGYTYILNTSGGMLLYADPSDDIMELVKKKLGIQ
ncbi:MAG: OmpH family outer membrane protein [Bacteroidetes bacterium]|nr:OmpH family outer membrane protein [Bacteroidota bacterium]